MKITITLNDLKLMNKGFGKIVQHKVWVPVLGCVLFKHDSGILTASATNLDETLTLHLPGTCIVDDSGPQSFLLGFSEIKRLATTLKNDDPISFNTAADQTVIETTLLDGREMSRVFDALPVEEFPSVPDIAVGVAFQPTQFLAAYRVTSPAVCADPTRKVLTSVFLEGKEKTLVATDGRRLMIQPLPGLPEMDNAVLPESKVLANGLLEAETGAIAVAMVGSVQWLRFDAGRWSYLCRCVEGPYPNYRQVIPNESMQWIGEVQIDPSDLPAIREAVTQFTDAKAGRETIVLYVNNGKVVILSMDKPAPDGQIPYLVLARSTATVTKPVLCALWAPFFVDGLSGGCHRIRIADTLTPLRSDSATGAIYIQVPWREDLGTITHFVNATFNAAIPAAQQKKKAKEDPEMKTTQAPASAPVSTTAAETAPVPVKPPAADESGQVDEAVIGRPPMQFHPSANPVEELMAELNDAHNKTVAVLDTLRGLRQKIKLVDRYYKNRAKEIETKAQVIAKFKQAVGF